MQDSDDLRRRLSESFSTILDKTFANRGVCCLTARLDSLLMWGHYANGHRGLCLEFDTHFEPFSSAKPVDYQADYPLFSVADVVLHENADHVFEMALCTKSAEWSYEEEWRLVHAEPDKEYCYPVGSLTGLYFGAEMPFVHQELLALVVRGSPTKLYEMRQGTTSYSVEAAAVQYTPHPQAGGGSA